MNSKAILLVSMAISAFALNAENVYDETTGFVYLTKSDNAKDIATSGSLAFAGNWSDGLAPHNDPPTNYYVAAGLTLRGPFEDINFPSPLFVAGTVKCYGTATKNSEFADLRILPGGELVYDNLVNIKGKITFVSKDAENPSAIRYTRSSNAAIKLNAEVVGEKESKVKVYSNASRISGLQLNAGSDWSRFEGTVVLGDGFGLDANKVGMVTPGSFVFGRNALINIPASRDSFFGNLSFAGDAVVTNSSKVDVAGVLDVGTNAKWCYNGSASRISTVGTFVVGDGADFHFTGINGAYALNITNRFVVGNDVAMSFDLDAVHGGDPAEYPVFRISPEAVAAGLPDFISISASMKMFSEVPPDAFLIAKDDSEVVGGKIVYLTHKPIVTYKSSDTTLDSQADQSNIWSDGEFPEAGKDYYLSDSQSSIRFKAPTAENPGYVTSFPGDRLIAADNCIVYLHTSVYIPSLCLYQRGTIYPRNSCTLTGKVTVHGTSSKKPLIQMLGDINFKLDSDIDGDEDITVQSYNPSGKGSTLYLGGNNGNWTGGITTAWTKNSSSPDASETSHTRIVVGKGVHLGGSLGAFRYDSLKLHNYSELGITNTTEFAEDTRGIFILDNGCLNVASGMTAKFAAPVTLNGVLRKTGDGVLSFGGALRFGENSDLSDVTAPEPGRNVIMVKSGSLKIENAKAIDGAAVQFADNASLVLDVRPQDVEMQTKGFVFTKANSSVASEGKIKVLFKGGDIADYERGIFVPVCTVDSAVAESFCKKFAVRIDLGDSVRNGTLSVTDNGDGTATVVAGFLMKGLKIIVR